MYIFCAIEFTDKWTKKSSSSALPVPWGPDSDSSYSDTLALGIKRSGT